MVLYFFGKILLFLFIAGLVWVVWDILYYSYTIPKKPYEQLSNDLDFYENQISDLCCLQREDSDIDYDYLWYLLDARDYIESELDRYERRKRILEKWGKMKNLLSGTLSRWTVGRVTT
ncbi:MAG: hypothetical protein J6Y37_06795 [Paludibacteraceae bacterium]|nr:hypothetical protein [Paludibacteraceae bacterium]